MPPTELSKRRKKTTPFLSHTRKTNTIFPNNLRSISFSFKSLKSAQKALIALESISFHKKIKVAGVQHFFDNQGFSLKEDRHLFYDQKIATAINFLEDPTQKPKPKFFK